MTRTLVRHFCTVNLINASEPDHLLLWPLEIVETCEGVKAFDSIYSSARRDNYA